MPRSKASKSKAKPPSQQFWCDACQCTMAMLEDWKNHVQGKRHQTNILLQPHWQDPYGCVSLDAEQEARLDAKRMQIEPIKQYCEHFKALVTAENEVEQAEVMERINEWPQWKLEDRGFGYFHMVPQAAPGNKGGVVFTKQDGTPLPFSLDLGVTQPVFVTASNATRVEESNRRVTMKGEVVAISRHLIEIKGLPSPLPASPDGTYRIDLANSDVTMQRMLQCLEALITSHATSTRGMQGSFGLGVLAPQSPIAAFFFADIVASQARARAHAASIYTSPLALDRTFSLLCKQPAPGLSNLLRNSAQVAEVNGDRQLDLVAARLNVSQREAIHCVVQDRAQLTLIQGPPGTGKTTTAVAIICEWLLKYRGKILATAYSNQGVNNLMAGLIAKGVRVIRVGKPDANRSEFHVDQVVEQNPLEQQRRRVKQELQEVRWRVEQAKRPVPAELLAQQQDLSRQLARLSSGTIMAQSIEQAEVVCTTCVGAGLGMLRGIPFPFVLIDEATQALEPAALIPFFHGSTQVVMIGDQCQLPPTVVSEEVARAGLDISLFDRLIGNGLETHILDTQYRMPPSISAFPAARFYKGLLKDGITAADRPLPVPMAGFEDGNLCIMHVDGAEVTQGTSKANLQEARCVVALVYQLARAGVELGSIGVITPYAAHVALISNELREVLGGGCRDLDISSVDGFQGQEKEVIILSTCRANPQREIGFVADWRRTNVSLTRARCVLAVVGHVDTLSADPLWRDLLAFHAHRVRRWDPDQKQAVSPRPAMRQLLVQLCAAAGDELHSAVPRVTVGLPRNSTSPSLPLALPATLRQARSAPATPLCVGGGRFPPSERRGSPTYGPHPSAHSDPAGVDAAPPLPPYAVPPDHHQPFRASPPPSPPQMPVPIQGAVPPVLLVAPPQRPRPPVARPSHAPRRPLSDAKQLLHALQQHHLMQTQQQQQQQPSSALPQPFHPPRQDSPPPALSPSYAHSPSISPQAWPAPPPLPPYAGHYATVPPLYPPPHGTFMSYDGEDVFLQEVAHRAVPYGPPAATTLGRTMRAAQRALQPEHDIVALDPMTPLPADQRPPLMVGGAY